MKSSLLGGTAILSSLVILTSCGTQPSDSSTTSEESQPAQVIQIGTISPLSGDAAAYGEQYVRVLDHHIESINEQYADTGVTFEFIHEDGKCSGNDSVSAYQKLRDIDGVSIIFGGLCSGETLAIAPLTTDGQALVVSGLSSNPEIEGKSDYVYTFSYSDSVVGETLAKALSEHDRVALITEQSDFTVGIRDAVVANLSENKIVANEVFAEGELNLRNTLEKVLSENPDAIFLNPNIGSASDALARQIAEIGSIDDVQLYGQVAYMDEETLSVVSEITNGMIVVDSPDIINEELSAIVSTIESSKGTLADIGTYYTASTLDMMNIILPLVAEHGDNPEKVKNALTTEVFDGFIGSVDFSQSNFPGVDGGVYKIENGTPVFQQ